MIEIDRHIEILLLSYECVIVPGLGGFMTHHVEARYDENDGLFLPPLRTLGFNPQLKLNDSLLAQSYVEAYDISYPEAVQRIEAEVDELKQHIQNEGSYELNDIGVLFLNEEGNYQFEPCEAGVLTPDLYGLDAFEMRPHEDRQEVEPAIKPATMARPAQSTETTSDTPQAEPRTHVEDDDEDDDEQKVIKIKVAWIRNAIAVAAAVIAFFAITPPISNSQLGNMQMGSMHSGLLPAIVQQETVAEPKAQPIAEIAMPTEEAPAMEESASQPEPQPVLAEVVEDKPYCIVLASRVTRRNAEAFVEHLHAAGHTEASVYVRGDVVRVTYGCYASENEAYGVLRKLREDSDFKQAWVYKKK